MEEFLLLKSHEQYIYKLKQVYTAFYSNNGMCPFFKQCSANMEKAKIMCDYSARVGVNYGSGKYPKVLMLGQEGINVHTVFEEPCRYLAEASRQHYPKTLYTLALILMGEQPKSWARKDLIIYEELFTHYTLTNYYKCAFSNDLGKVNGLKHNDSMNGNCFKLLLKEIDVLEPDLLVVQGKFTTQAFWSALDQTYDKGVCIWKNKTDTVELYRHQLNGNPFYMLYSYHPASPQWSNNLNDLKTAIEFFNRAYDAEKI